MVPDRSAVQRLVCALVLAALAGCSMPIYQYDLKDQPLTCPEANERVFQTLQAMDFTITAFDPAAIGRPGVARGVRTRRDDTQKVTVTITCAATGATIDASEDGALLNQVEFKRGFYLSFTGMASQAAADAAAAQAEAARPFEQKKSKGLQVQLSPVRGLGSKLHFDLDLSAASVLPVLLTINNVTTRTYVVDATDIALVQKDGTRVRPLSVDDAAARVAAAGSRVVDAGTPLPDRAAVAQRLEARRFTSTTVAAKQNASGYIYFPLGEYVKGRVTLEDKESEESEGVVVEFK